MTAEKNGSRPRRPLGIARRNQPKQVGDILASSFTLKRVASKLRDCAALPYWSEIVGPELSAVTTPDKIIRRHLLVVRVQDATWAQELTLRRDEILERISSYPWGARIDDLKFVTGDPRSIGSKQQGK